MTNVRDENLRRCWIAGCEKKIFSRLLCGSHYNLIGIIFARERNGAYLKRLARLKLFGKWFKKASVDEILLRINKSVRDERGG